MDIYVLMRKEAEVFAQAPVLHLNCSEAKLLGSGQTFGKGAGPVWAGEMPRLWGTS